MCSVSPKVLVYTGVLNFNNVAPSEELHDMDTGFKINKCNINLGS